MMIVMENAVIEEQRIASVMYYTVPQFCALYDKDIADSESMGVIVVTHIDQPTQSFIVSDKEEFIRLVRILHKY